MSNQLYLTYDGDGCGKKVGRAIMANDEKALHEWSAKIDLGHEIVNHWVAEHGGKRISGGGDEGSFKLPEEAVENIEELRKDYYYATDITISVGIGSSLSEAGRSLLAAKFRGKDQVARYDESVEKDIEKAKKKVKKGKASQEEYKLAEAYLKKVEGENMADQNLEQECKYCDESDGVDPSHCKYCHDNEQAASGNDCPFCEENAQEAQGSDCPYCAENAEDADACPFCEDDKASGEKLPETAEQDNHAAEQNTKIQSPDSNDASAPAGSQEERDQASEMGMNPPVEGKPELGNNSSPVGIGQANPMDNTAGAPVEPPGAQADEVQANDSLIPEEGAHSKESLQAIAQKIEGEDAEGQPEDKQVADQIDDTEVVGDETEGNASRPDGFGANTPGDVGLDSEHPQEEDADADLSGVLQEGLDNNADDIKREKARTMIGQALSGFKANKQVLEAAKEQAPDFYNASIAMLAAMINMAEMLGLKGGGDSDLGAEQPGQENEWHDPFPTHPDKGGEPKPGHAAPKEGAAEAPKGDAPIGQPIGKLPSKATHHVARTPMPPGAVNAKGQQKVIDPKTGKTRFIDRKQGMVQSTTGVPIKPPKRDDNEQPQA